MSSGPSPADYDLSAEQARLIFDEQIKPQLQGVAREQPAVVFIAGQPGSGKTSAQSAFLAQLGQDDVVALDGDDLMTYHPEHHALAVADDLTPQKLLGADMDRWWYMAVDYIRANRFDVVISAPLAGADWAGERMREFRAAGYRVEVAFVAVHEARSLLGIVDRYQSQRDNHGTGRWVSPEAHDRAYAGTLVTAQLVEAQALADAVYVLARGGQVLYRNQLVDGQWQQPARIREAIEDERARPWTPAEQDQFLARAAVQAPRVTGPVKIVLADAVQRALTHLQGRDAGGSITARHPTQGRPTSWLAPSTSGQQRGSAGPGSER